MTDLSAIIDQIYEAAFLPDTWYPILDQMAAATGAQGTSLVSTVAPSTKWLASPSLEDMKIKMIDEGWYRHNTRTDKLLSIEHHGFVNEADFFTEDDYNTMPIFTGMMRPLGYGFGTSTFIGTPSGEKIIVAAEKKKATGPVERSAIAYLDELRPHLARAAMMSSRLEFERINAAVEALQLANLPSAVLRHDGRMIAGNRLLEEFAPQLTIAARDLVRFEYAPAIALLAEALENARTSGSIASRSFPLPRIEDAPPAIVHLMPVRGSARYISKCGIFPDCDSHGPLAGTDGRNDPRPVRPNAGRSPRGARPRHRPRRRRYGGATGSQPRNGPKSRQIHPLEIRHAATDGFRRRCR